MLRYRKIILDIDLAMMSEKIPQTPSLTGDLLSYKGKINNQVLRVLIHALEDKLLKEGEKMRVAKKVNSVLIEMMQNMNLYAIEQFNMGDSAPEVGVVKTEEGFEIRTQNVVSDDTRQKLTAKLTQINSLDRKELRNFYKERLADQSFNSSGGAGLGLIDVAKKAKKNELSFSFKTYSDSYSLFNLRVVI